MKRVFVLAGLFVSLSVGAAACGSTGSGASGTLPPIATTTSTTTTLATTTTMPEFYVVQAGDNLNKIVAKLGVSKADLMALNGITNPDHVEKGRKLKVPRPGVVIPTTVAASVAVTAAPPAS
ncbi:MAG: LysM domain-containing protein [Ilumatobacteraceae bacterium]